MDPQRSYELPTQAVMIMPNRPGILTPKQVARAVGVSESSVKRWCDAGLIQTVRTEGGHRRLPIDSVQEFLQQTGHPVVAPEILDLPSTTTGSKWALRRSLTDFMHALAIGSASMARVVVNNLRDADYPLSAILDDVVFHAMNEILQRVDQHDELGYVHHQAAEICLRLLYELRSSLQPPEPTAPAALTAALDGAPNTLNVTAAELTLRSIGWNATSLGTRLPFNTLGRALEQHRPRLCYLDVAAVRDANEFVLRFASLLSTANANSTVVVVGGAGLSDELLAKLDVKAACQNWSELEKYATTAV